MNLVNDSVQIYRRLFRSVAPYWQRLLVAFVCSLPLSLCSAGIAYLVKPALDEVFLKKDMRMLMLIPLGVVALYAVRGTFDYAYSYALGSVGQAIINDFRKRVYVHLQRLSLSFFSKHPTGVIISRMTNDINLLQRAISSDFLDFFKDAFSIISLSVVLFKQDARLASVAFLFLPWVAIPILRFGKKTRKISTRGQEKIGALATFIHETINGSRIVKAFGMEEYENRRFAQENVRLFRITLKRLKVRAMTGPLMEFIGGCAGAAVIFYGGYSVFNGQSTPGTFFSFVAALLLLYSPLKKIGTAYQDIQEGLAGAKRVYALLDTEPEITERPGAKALPAVRGDICFERVSFAYNSKPVLQDVSLRIKPGETVAIVGMTGSGKTTLVNLIPRFFDVLSGAITIDGHDIRDVTLFSLRSQISLVSQHSYLFHDTVGNNIAAGGVLARSDQNIIAAAKAAHAHEFIQELPNGYDTIVGEHGEKLSGGQRQRIAIARAVLKNAPILLLDEATSSMDSELEARIQQSLESLASSRTTLIIAHRLSTIRNADRIIVLADGRVVEEGTHAQLCGGAGEYAKLYSIYLREEERSRGVAPGRTT